MGTLIRDLLKRFLIWRLRHVEHRHFVLFLSILVGILSGVAAAIIKNAVHLIQSDLLVDLFGIPTAYFFLLPCVGLLLTITVMKFLLPRKVGHGIPAALYAISKRKSEMRSHNMYSSIITSALTVGFGGSAGLEGPTVATGASWGSNLGRLFRLDYKTKTLLIGCAAAGALSAIFKAPVAAIVFAIEIIMLDLTAASLIPLLLASVSAVITSYLFMGEGFIFHFTLKDSFVLRNVPFYILLGVFTGMGSLYFSKTFFGIENFFERIRGDYVRGLLGGVLLAPMIYFFPPLYGEGYELINGLIQGEFSSSFFGEDPAIPVGKSIYWGLLSLFALVVLKVVATSVTFGSGGIGGIFAPTLFMGSSLGFVFAKALHHFELVSLPQGNFALVGMAGMMAGVLHAPLTAIFLIAEITGGYELFVPLMITAAISYLTVRAFMKHSVYTQQLAKRGELITHHKDQAVLSMMDLEREIENEFEKVRPDDTLGGLCNAIARSKRDLFPVVDEEGKLLGVVFLHEIRDIIFDRERYDKVYVEELMTTPPALVEVTEDMSEVMEKFQRTGAWNLPVVEDGKYKGFVSKSKLFEAYRDLLVEFSEE